MSARGSEGPQGCLARGAEAGSGVPHRAHHLHRSTTSGCAHCDVKPYQICVVLGSDSTLASCTLVDMGSSSGFSGNNLALSAPSSCNMSMSCSTEVHVSLPVHHTNQDAAQQTAAEEA